MSIQFALTRKKGKTQRREYSNALLTLNISNSQRYIYKFERAFAYC